MHTTSYPKPQGSRPSSRIAASESVRKNSDWTKGRKVLASTANIKEIHDKMRERMQDAHDSSIRHANKTRETAPQLRRGDGVYMLTSNFHTRRPSNASIAPRSDSFQISNPTGPVTYTLELSKDVKSTQSSTSNDLNLLTQKPHLKQRPTIRNTKSISKGSETTAARNTLTTT